MIQLNTAMSFLPQEKAERLQQPCSECIIIAEAAAASFGVMLGLNRALHLTFLLPCSAVTTAGNVPLQGAHRKSQEKHGLLPHPANLNSSLPCKHQVLDRAEGSWLLTLYRVTVLCVFPQVSWADVLIFVTLTLY